MRTPLKPRIARRETLQNRPRRRTDGFEVVHFSPPKRRSKQPKSTKVCLTEVSGAATAALIADAGSLATKVDLVGELTKRWTENPNPTLVMVRKTTISHGIGIFGTIFKHAPNRETFYIHRNFQRWITLSEKMAPLNVVPGKCLITLLVYLL